MIEETIMIINYNNYDKCYSASRVTSSEYKDADINEGPGKPTLHSVSISRVNVQSNPYA